MSKLRLSSNLINQNKILTNINLVWKTAVHQSFIPEIREGKHYIGATLTSVGTNAYLFGGLSRKLFNQISLLKFNNLQINSDIELFQWEDFNNENFTVLPISRFGHCSVVYEDNILIFGGAGRYYKTTKSRLCFNDLFIFRTNIMQWEEIKVRGPIFIEARHHHAGCIIGKHLLIHGGINDQGKYLDDVYISNITKFQINKNIRWTNIITKNNQPPKMAYHNCCLVLES